jgi:hypothetical protein
MENAMLFEILQTFDHISKDLDDFEISESLSSLDSRLHLLVEGVRIVPVDHLYFADVGANGLFAAELVVFHTY